MDDESYNLPEVAEMLGISRRALHKRLREGIFPHRFLAQGRHGLETRIPARDVEAALYELRQRPIHREPALASMVSSRAPSPAGPDEEPVTDTPTILPVPRAEQLPQRIDTEKLRDALVAIVREDRDEMLRALRGALASRDQEIHGLRTQMVEVHRAVERLRERIEGWELAQFSAPHPDPGILNPPAPSAEEDLVDQLLRELAELEGLVEHRS